MLAGNPDPLKERVAGVLSYGGGLRSLQGCRCPPSDKVLWRPLLATQQTCAGRPRFLWVPVVKDPARAPG